MGGGGGDAATLWLRYLFQSQRLLFVRRSQQASECQAEQGRDDSREANPLK